MQYYVQNPIQLQGRCRETYTIPGIDNRCPRNQHNVSYATSERPPFTKKHGQHERPSPNTEGKLILGSPKRVKIAIKTLMNMGLLIEKINPQDGQRALVRNLSSGDAIKLIKNLSRKMTDSSKSYIHNS